MTNEIKLTVDQPAPGQFVWTLLEDQPDGAHPLIIRSSGDPFESADVALANGQRALEGEIRNRDTIAPHDDHLTD